MARNILQWMIAHLMWVNDQFGLSLTHQCYTRKALWDSQSHPMYFAQRCIYLHKKYLHLIQQYFESHILGHYDYKSCHLGNVIYFYWREKHKLIPCHGEKYTIHGPIRRQCFCCRLSWRRRRFLYKRMTPEQNNLGN